jgi:hypothetical protein
MENRQPVVASIRTERVELVSMSLAFMQALVAGDLDTATREMGAVVPAYLREGLRNFLRAVQIDFEDEAGNPTRFSGTDLLARNARKDP